MVEQFWNCQRSLNSCLVVASAELVSTAPGWSNVNCISLLLPSHSILSCLSHYHLPTSPACSVNTSTQGGKHSLSFSFPLFLSHFALTISFSPLSLMSIQGCCLFSFPPSSHGCFSQTKIHRFFFPPSSTTLTSFHAFWWKELLGYLIIRLEVYSLLLEGDSIRWIAKEHRLWN